MTDSGSDEGRRKSARAIDVADRLRESANLEEADTTDSTEIIRKWRDERYGPDDS